jgi:predicted transcriptional regulator
MKRASKPTDAELEVLRVLWSRGPSTVRQIHDVLDREKPRGYTTILKTIQIMTEKRLVLRDTSDRRHVYRARLSEDRTQRQLLRDLIDRAFGGSAANLMLQVFGSDVASPEEIAELEAMLAEQRARGRDD